MSFFKALDNLERLPGVLNGIRRLCLDYQPDEKEQLEIEKAVGSIDAGMAKLQRILNKYREKNY